MITIAIDFENGIVVPDNKMECTIKNLILKGDDFAVGSMLGLSWVRLFIKRQLIPINKIVITDASRSHHLTLASKPPYQILEGVRCVADEVADELVFNESAPMNYRAERFKYLMTHSGNFQAEIKLHAYPLYNHEDTEAMMKFAETYKDGDKYVYSKER